MGFLAKVNSRGVPAWANLWLGLISAFCALIFSLEVLVEMMSIGTLLAYTLVDACVLIIRYQPNKSPTHPAFIEMFDDKDHANGEKIRMNARKEVTLPTDPEKQADDEVEDWLTVVFQLVKGTHKYQQYEEATVETGAMATKMFSSLSLFILLFDIILVLIQDTASSHTFLLVIFVMVLVMVVHLVAISSLPQTRPSVRGFQTPGVPLIPSLGILINIYLMFRLSPLTLVRFAVWMLLGFITYFKYGILQ